MVEPTASQDPRRHYPRADLSKGIPVGWRGGGKHGVATVTSISLGGLFISTPDPPTADAVVALLFDVPSGEVRANAVVRRVVPGQGMGVQFVNMSFDARARLYQLLKKLL